MLDRRRLTDKRAGIQLSDAADSKPRFLCCLAESSCLASKLDEAGCFIASKE